MRPVIDYWVLAPIDNARATPLETLQNTVEQCGGLVIEGVTPYTEQGYLVVVFGGFNIVADFKKLLT